MKSILDEFTHPPRLTTISRGPARYRRDYNPNEGAITRVVLSAFFVVIVALSLVMFVKFYHWSGQAPIFTLGSADQPATLELTADLR